MLTVSVENANPNGDPLSGNQPRTDSDGYGLITDVAIKHKIRHRLHHEGEDVLVLHDDIVGDGAKSILGRIKNYFEGELNLKIGKKLDPRIVLDKSFERWYDVRAFGQVYAFSGQDFSISATGAVSVNISKSLYPITVNDLQITKSINGSEEGIGKKGSDTMGTKSVVTKGVYVIKGSINAYLAEANGFTEEDIEKLKQVLLTLFANDVSAARPAGSMEVEELFWFTHSNKLGNVSTKRVFDLLEFNTEIDNPDVANYEDYEIQLNQEKVEEYQSKGLTVEYLSF